MRSGILRTRIATLRLNPVAPWPSKIKERATRFLLGHKVTAAMQWQGFPGRQFPGICPIKRATKLRLVK